MKKNKKQKPSQKAVLGKASIGELTADGRRHCGDRRRWQPRLTSRDVRRPAAGSVAAGWKEGPAPGVERSVAMGRYIEMAHSSPMYLSFLRSCSHACQLGDSLGAVSALHGCSSHISTTISRRYVPGQLTGKVAVLTDSISYIKLYPTKGFLHRLCLMVSLCM